MISPTSESPSNPPRPHAQSTWPGRRTSDLASLLGVDVDDTLFQQALTHRSFAFEQGALPHNERLEFLGDSVLGLVVTDELYHRHADLCEGDLARIRSAVVNMRALARVARSLNVGPCVRLGKGELLTQGQDKDSILADTLEALLGAVYLVRGLDHIDSFIRTQFTPLITEAVTTRKHTDWKTSLQELAAMRKEPAPRYEVTAVGPDHAKEFTAVALVGEVRLGKGQGRSKKVAEQHAAQQACEVLLNGEEHKSTAGQPATPTGSSTAEPTSPASA